MDLAEALEAVFSLDIPYLPTFPGRADREGMIGQVLADFPGWEPLSAGGMGWNERRFKKTSANRDLGPLPGAWEAFLEEVRRRRVPWVKLQWTGPLTLAQTMETWPTNQTWLQQEAFPVLGERLFLQVERLIRPLHSLGTRVILFWDEPGFALLDWNRPLQLAGFTALGELLQRSQELGAVTGVHCCGSAALLPLLDLSIQILSLDTRLTLSGLLKSPDPVRAFFDRGGRLALGAVPTQEAGEGDVSQLARSLRETFTQAFGKAARQYLSGCLLTPACGLAMKTKAESEAVFQALAKLQGQLTLELTR